jgi:ankyrin repeat protein
MEALRYLLQQEGAFVSAVDSSGDTPLHAALRSRHLDAALLLLDKGADPNAVSRERLETPLHVVCREKTSVSSRNSGEVAVKTVQEEEQQSERKSKGEQSDLLVIDTETTQSTEASSSLMQADVPSQASVVSELIRLGAHVDACDCAMSTPLHVACLANSVEAAVLLLESGADVNALNSDLASSLHLACQSADLDVVRLLLSQGASVNSLDLNHRTPAFYACERDDVTLVSELIQAGACLNIADVNGRTVLLHACHLYCLTEERRNQENQTVIKESVEAETSRALAPAEHVEDGVVPQSDVKSASPAGPELRLQITSNKTESGEDVPVIPESDHRPSFHPCNVKPRQERPRRASFHDIGSHSLHVPDTRRRARRGRLRRSSVHVDGDRIITPHHTPGVACTGETGRPVHRRRRSSSIVHLSSENMELIELLLNHGATVNAKDSAGRTVLHYACVSGNMHVVNIFLERGAEVNSADCEGKTALHLVAPTGNVFVLGTLLRHEADVNKADITGKTPLHYAADGNRLASVRCLLQSSAHINAQDQDGATPLHLAARQGCTDMVELLLGYDADIHVTDCKGCTPLHFAMTSGNREVIDMLIGAGASTCTVNCNGKTPGDMARDAGFADRQDCFHSIALSEGSSVNRPTVVQFEKEDIEETSACTYVNEKETDRSQKTEDSFNKTMNHCSQNSETGSLLHLEKDQDQPLSSDSSSSCSWETSSASASSPDNRPVWQQQAKLSETERTAKNRNNQKFNNDAGNVGVSSQGPTSADGGRSNLGHFSVLRPIFSANWQAMFQVSSDGGRFQKPFSDVLLTVPPSAVAEGTTVNVHTAVSTRIDLVRRAFKLPETEEVVSPLAEFSVGVDFRFDRRVCVTLPHFLPPEFDPELVCVYHGEPDMRDGKISAKKMTYRHVAVDFERQNGDDVSPCFQSDRSCRKTDNADGSVNHQDHSQLDNDKRYESDTDIAHGNSNTLRVSRDDALEGRGREPGETLRKTGDESGQLCTDSYRTTSEDLRGNNSRDFCDGSSLESKLSEHRGRSFFTFAADGRLLIYTDRFCGFVCTFCHKKAKKSKKMAHPPPLYAMLNGSAHDFPLVTISLIIWDARITVTDFLHVSGTRGIDQGCG